MTSKPRIAILLDENTSNGGTHYNLNKDYVQAIVRAGGLPYAIPYVPNIGQQLVLEFDGFYNVGGDIQFPDHWLAPGHQNLFPFSERLPIDMSVTQSFLDARKPILGTCHGMQILSGLNGGSLRCDVGDRHRSAALHAHDVTITPGSLLHKIIEVDRLTVNSRHSQAVNGVGAGVKVAAQSVEDDVIEAIEIPAHPFALGLQWHPENFWREDTPGNKIFTAFVSACLAESQRTQPSQLRAI